MWQSALAQGAAACLVEHEGVDAFGFDRGEFSDRIASYPGLKAATGPIASAFYGNPSAALEVLAVTGTNGKTSTAWWLAEALSTLTVPGGVRALRSTAPPSAACRRPARSWARWASACRRSSPTPGSPRPTRS
jgi:UDP-N-acetylmuramyl tripeptide synthase